MNRLIIGILSLSVLLSLAGCGSEEETAPSEFSVDFLSTGKSDCAVIVMDGLVILSDAADTDDANAIAEVLRRRGAEKIDYIIISHYDKDHIGAAGKLIRTFPVGKVLRPNYVENSDEFEDMEAAVAQRDTEDLIITENYVITTEHGSILVDPPDKDYGDDNNNSVLTTVTYRNKKLLFMGDARKKRIEEFMSAAESRYDLIKLPHHGDSCKPLLRLLEDTRPAWAVEMLSAKESVEKDLLEKLNEVGTELFLTRDGAVQAVWTADGLKVTQK